MNLNKFWSKLSFILMAVFCVILINAQAATAMNRPSMLSKSAVHENQKSLLPASEKTKDVLRIVPTDKNSIQELQRKALQEDAEAQYKLGMMYNNGIGVQKDLKKSFEWTEKSARHGFLQAQSDLCLIYDMGWGTPRDEKKAFQWCAKAAVQNFPEGIYHLGYLYLLGHGTGQSISKGSGFVKKASLLKDEGALKFSSTAVDGCLKSAPKHSRYQVAQCFYAANLGNAKAAANAAYAFYGGLYVRKDMAKAAYWYSKAALGGVTSSQAMLGVMYAAGQGVPKDNAKAYAWLTIASEKHDNPEWQDKAAKVKIVLEAGLSPQERALMVKKALEYQKSYIQEQEK